jgi:hypothetical protein
MIRLSRKKMAANNTKTVNQSPDALAMVLQLSPQEKENIATCATRKNGTSTRNRWKRNVISVVS